jgi:hypothetical protein
MTRKVVGVFVHFKYSLQTHTKKVLIKFIIPGFEIQNGTTSGDAVCK